MRAVGLAAEFLKQDCEVFLKCRYRKKYTLQEGICSQGQVLAKPCSVKELEGMELHMPGLDICTIITEDGRQDCGMFLLGKMRIPEQMLN